jgi:hypothetical protein
VVLIKDKTTATLTTSVLTAGTHVLTAMYLADASFSSSTSPFAETVYSVVVINRLSASAA